MIRGAKSIADKCDWGSILLNATEEDLEKVQEIVKLNGLPMPNMKLSIYKNRGGKYTNMFLWIDADKSTCRYNPIFATDYQCKYIQMKDTIINMGGE